MRPMTVVASVASFDDAYTASAAWEYAKQTVAAMLIDATKQRKLHRCDRKAHLAVS